MQCQSFLGSLVSANPSWLVGSYKLIANIFPLVFLVFLILSSYEHLVQLYPIKVHVSHNKKIILNWCHYQLQILYSSSMPKITSTQLLGRKIEKQATRIHYNHFALDYTWRILVYYFLSHILTVKFYIVYVIYYFVSSFLAFSVMQ